jgi:hypothetical protein
MAEVGATVPRSSLECICLPILRMGLAVYIVINGWSVKLINYL